MSTHSEIQHACTALEGILNNPFPSDESPKPFDKIHLSKFGKCDLGNLHEVGKLFTGEERVYYDMFLTEVADALRSQFHGHEFRPGLRASRLGYEPILLGLNQVGIPTGTGVTNIWTVFAGHLYEAYVRFVFRCRGLTIGSGNFHNNYCEWLGVGGHFDFMLTTPRGLEMVVEVKHISPNVCDRLLEPETQLNASTRRLNKTGRNLSALSDASEWLREVALSGRTDRTGWNLSNFKDAAFESDIAGYLSQAAFYQVATGKPAVFVICDKRRNTNHVVPLTDRIAAKAVMRMEAMIPVIQSLKTVADVFEDVEVPAPIPQFRGGVPTGDYMIPFGMRFVPEWLLESVYQPYTLNGKVYVSERPRPIEEIVKRVAYYQSAML